MLIKITDANEAVKAQGEGQLIYNAEYAEGDAIIIDGTGFGVIAPEDTLAPVLGFFDGQFKLPVPFEEGKRCYSPKSFTGDRHFLWARQALPHEITAYRNVAANAVDNPANDGFFPHAAANIETRGESVFFARNVIDGVNAHGGHGSFPFGSWGINRREDACLKVDFGADVVVDRLALALRSDFPHDNWWKSATVEFSDGSVFKAEFAKTGNLQVFEIAPRVTRHVILRDMKKDEEDPSPFPALNQLEVWGHYTL